MSEELQSGYDCVAENYAEQFRDEMDKLLQYGKAIFFDGRRRLRLRQRDTTTASSQNPLPHGLMVILVPTVHLPAKILP